MGSTLKENPLRLGNSRAQHFSDTWLRQGSTATAEQKDGVGLAYISKILGLGDEAAQQFARRVAGHDADPQAFCRVGRAYILKILGLGARSESDIYHRVGMRQGGAESYDSDLEAFWEEVQSIFPDSYSEADITFLVEQGGKEATTHLLWQLEWPLANSPVLRALSINAHGYK